MKSNNQNLDHVLSVNNIDLQREVDSWKVPTVKKITQDLYDLIQVKDPLTIYVIDGANDGRIYLGEHLIPKQQTSTNYLVGINQATKEYVLYMNLIDNYQDCLIPISRYKNPDDAFDAMTMCMNAGSHQTINLALFTSIAAFIDGYITVNDLILGIISLLGFRNDPRLQTIMEVSISFGVNQNKSDLPALFREELPSMAKRYDNNLFDLYAKIYNIIVKYNFFKDKKYHIGTENIDLTDPISDIVRASETIIGIA